MCKEIVQQNKGALKLNPGMQIGISGIFTFIPSMDLVPAAAGLALFEPIKLEQDPKRHQNV